MTLSTNAIFPCRRNGAFWRAQIRIIDGLTAWGQKRIHRACTQPRFLCGGHFGKLLMLIIMLGRRLSAL